MNQQERISRRAALKKILDGYEDLINTLDFVTENKDYIYCTHKVACLRNDIEALDKQIEEHRKEK